MYIKLCLTNKYSLSCRFFIMVLDFPTPQYFKAQFRRKKNLSSSTAICRPLHYSLNVLCVYRVKTIIYSKLILVLITGADYLRKCNAILNF